MPISLTINGIDGFSSGKWSLHANAKAIDDETMELNAIAGSEYSSYETQIKAGNVVTLSFAVSDVVRYEVRRLSDNSVLQARTTVVLPFTYKANEDVKFIVWLTSLSSGKFTFKRPMLNLGSIPAPYEKKRGDRMVLPVPKKNLLNLSTLEIGGLGATGQNTVNANLTRTGFIPVKPNTQYSISKTIDEWFTVRAYDTGMSWISQLLDIKAKNGTFTTPNNCYFLRVSFNNVLADISNAQPQLEQGTTPTPFEPYAVQLNEKPKKALSPSKQVVTSKRVLVAKR